MIYGSIFPLRWIRNINDALRGDNYIQKSLYEYAQVGEELRRR